MEHQDVIQLTAELIAEYCADGYQGDHLQPGDWVWLDEGCELYMTADEIFNELGRVESAIANGDWGDEGWERRRDVLRSALERLQGL